MRIIVKDIYSDHHYLIDTNPLATVGPRPNAIKGPDTLDNLEKHLKLANYYDFYYIPSYRGAPQRREVTSHYSTSKCTFYKAASGWWLIE